MELWGQEHIRIWLPTLIVEIVLAIVLGIVLKNKSKRIRFIPVAVITGILVVLEIAKQIYCLAGGEGGTYFLYRLPVHFCSLVIYTFPFFVYLGMSKKEHNGIFAKFIKSFTITVSGVILFFMVIYPAMVYDLNSNGTYFLTFHTITFHHLAVFAILFMISLNLFDFNAKRDILCLVIGIAIYATVTGTLANVLQVNFGNLYYCPIELIDQFRLSLISSVGWFGQAIYVAVFAVAEMAFAVLCYYTIRLIELIKSKITSKKKTDEQQNS